jgi:hypothetical protein
MRERSAFAMSQQGYCSSAAPYSHSRCSRTGSMSTARRAPRRALSSFHLAGATPPRRFSYRFSGTGSYPRFACTNIQSLPCFT